jgi:hypothetical protein
LKTNCAAQRLLADSSPDFDPPSGALGAVGCQSHGATFPRLERYSLPDTPLYATDAEADLAIKNCKWLAGLTGDATFRLIMLRLRREHPPR